MRTRLTVIVPVLNEAGDVSAFLVHLRERLPDAELIVVDGGSTDGTPDLAATLGDRLVRTKRGRARQMNAGAAVASGEVLWFVHADSRLPEQAGEAVLAAVEAGAVGGCLRIRIPDPAAIYRISDRWGNAAVDRFRLALGDHGIFCTREAFEKVGGYPEVLLMEDAELYRKLGRLGRVRQLPLHIETSPRRYQSFGPYRTTAIYTLILFLYIVRVPIPVLARIYRLVSTRSAQDAKTPREKS